MAKRSGSIKLSPKHGVNPSMLHCFICGKETGIALLGKLKGDKEAPRDISNPSEICEDCQKQIDAGNKFILEVKNEEEVENPERTGRMVCVKGSALPDIKAPISYMPKSLYEKVFGEFIK